MPPESLSTLAVMKPGPRTARNSNIRIRQRFHMPGVPMEDSLKVFSHEDSSKTITGEGRMSEVPGDHHDVMRIDFAQLLVILVHWYTCRSKNTNPSKWSASRPGFAWKSAC